MIYIAEILEKQGVTLNLVGEPSTIDYADMVLISILGKYEKLVMRISR